MAENTYVKFLRGTPAAYAKLVEKDENTLYFIRETSQEGPEKVGSLYLGDVLLAGNLSEDGKSVIDTLKELKDVNLGETVTDGKVLAYDQATQKWVPKEVSAVFEAPPAGQVFTADVDAGADHTEALTTAVGGQELHDGDIAIIRETISGEIKGYTAYVYKGTKWEAMDGNYNAENVYFDKDLTTTTAIGNITLSNGQATIPATGKNLKQVFDTIFVKESNPTVTQPAVTVSCPQAKAYEVGTKVTPSYTATLLAGSYQFGPATGITASTWSVTDTNQSKAQTSNTGTFTEITVADNTNYKITATATYADGAVPKTNVGNDYAAGQIKAGSKVGTSGAITGYRNTFYGTTEDKDPLTSATIRGLAGKSNKALANNASTTVTIPVGAMRVVFAYPGTLRDVTSIKDVNGLNAEILSSFSHTTMTVEGASGEAGIEYKVYTLEYASANNTANKYTVVI